MTDCEAFEVWYRDQKFAYCMSVKGAMFKSWKLSRKVALEDAARDFDRRALPYTGYYEIDELAIIIIRSLK